MYTVVLLYPGHCFNLFCFTLQLFFMSVYLLYFQNVPKFELMFPKMKNGLQYLMQLFKAVIKSTCCANFKNK